MIILNDIEKIRTHQKPAYLAKLIQIEKQEMLLQKQKAHILRQAKLLGLNVKELKNLAKISVY